MWGSGAEQSPGTRALCVHTGTAGGWGGCLGGGASLPALAQPPPWWHLILLWDSALERLESARSRWPSESAWRLSPPGQKLWWLSMWWGSWGHPWEEAAALREALGLGFFSPWLLSRSP